MLATSDAVHAMQGDGAPLVGWPRPVQHIAPIPFDNAHPVIGDLDNDGHQDVVLTADADGTDWLPEQWVWAWGASGDALPGFPFWLPTLNDWAPAIADIDGNGRSELCSRAATRATAGAGHPACSPSSTPPARPPRPTGASSPAVPGGRASPARRRTPTRRRRHPVGDATPFALVRDTGPGPAGSDPEDLVVLDGGHVVYTADTAGAGRELWISDGTTAGTRQLADIRPGSGSSAPDQLVARDGRAWFAADDGVHGREVWTTDGTATGTRLVHDTEPGSYGSQPQELTLDATGRLFFTARTVRGRDLWVSGGGQTQLVVDLTPAEANGNHDDSQAKWLATVGNRVVWVSRVRPALGDSVDVNLVSTTGPGAPVVQLLPGVDLAENAGEPLFTGGATTGDTFAWVQVQNRLVRTDGTLAGTVVQQWPDYDDPQQGSPVPRGDQALFAAHDDAVSRELFAFPDRLVADLDTTWPVPGTLQRASGAPADLTLWDGGWFFTARTITEGREPWWTDGADDTRQLGEVVPGMGGSRPTPLLTLGDRMLLRATTAESGAEPWILSAEGAVRVADVAPGGRGSNAGEAIRLGDRVLVVMDDGASGRELWSVDLAAIPTPTSWPSGPTPTPTPDSRRRAPTPTPTPTTPPSVTPTPSLPSTTPTAGTPTTTPAPVPTAAPDTRWGRRPAERTRARTARFTFRSTVAASTFQCRLDRRRWRTCVSPATFGRLDPGRHVLRVRAVDGRRSLRRGCHPGGVRWRVW